MCVWAGEVISRSFGQLYEFLSQIDENILGEVRAVLLNITHLDKQFYSRFIPCSYLVSKFSENFPQVFQAAYSLTPPHTKLTIWRVSINTSTLKTSAYGFKWVFHCRCGQINLSKVWSDQSDQPDSLGKITRFSLPTSGQIETCLRKRYSICPPSWAGGIPKSQDPEILHIFHSCVSHMVGSAVSAIKGVGGGPAFHFSSFFRL